MTIANKLYDRPHGFVGDVNATNPEDLPVLYISGTFKQAVSGSPYEGRLNINNAIGKCSTQLLTGNLPPGYTLTVDNINKQIVLRWPSFTSATTQIPNYNFANGDDGSWEMGQGWSIMEGITAPDPNDPGNDYQAQFANVNGDSMIMSNFYAPVARGIALGGIINASVDVQQGASSANKTGAAVRILFYDAVGFQVGGADGEVIKSGSDSQWKTSVLQTHIPSNAIYARIGATAYRSSQNRALWVDNFNWDLQQPSAGTNTQQTIPLSLQVTDSVERTAIWQGSVIVGPPIAIYSNGSTYRSTDKLRTSTNLGGVVQTVLETNNGFIGAEVSGSTSVITFYSSFDGLTWSPLSTIDISTVAPGKTASIYGFRKSSSAHYLLEDWTGLWRSTDQGKTWVLIKPAGNTASNGSLWCYDKIVIFGNSGIANGWVSNDDGLTYSALGSLGAIYGLGYLNNYYWFVTETGNIYKSDPTGANWTLSGSWPYGSLVSAWQIDDDVYFTKLQGTTPTNPVYITNDLVTYTLLTSPTNPSRISTVNKAPWGEIFLGNDSSTYVLIDGSLVQTIGSGPRSTSLNEYTFLR